jgi:hypothetical protein
VGKEDEEKEKASIDMNQRADGRKWTQRKFDIRDLQR